MTIMMNNKMELLSLALAVSALLLSGTQGFVLAPRTTPMTKTNGVATRTTTSTTTSTQLCLAADNNTNKKKPFDEKLRSKLVSEAIAPWRTVRLFLYGTLGAGALVGGLITLAGTAAALQGARPDLDLNEQYKNLAIDFGAVAIFGFLAKFDVDKGRALDDQVVDKIAQTKQKKAQQKGLQAREQTLGTLKLDITTGPEQTQTAAVRELQAGARQHLIVVIGPRKACRDALIGANLLKMDFAMSNVLVVPYETDVDAMTEATRPTGTGFGERPIYETQPYVARPAGEGWDEWCQAEMTDAVAQNGDSTRTEGIAIVVANNGKVIRRGVGKVPWRQMVEQLETEASGSGAAEATSAGFF